MYSFFLFVFFTIFLTTESNEVIPILDPNQVTHDFVELDRWKFYNFSVEPNVGWSLKVKHSVGVTGFNDIDIYVLKEGVPDRSKYTYTDLSLKSDISIIGLAISSPTYYIVGIFGFRGQRTYFTVTLELNNGCNENCNNHGTCTNSVCYCYSGYTGNSCQYTTQSVTLGTNYEATVNSDNWLYYTVEIFTANNINISVIQTSGEVDLYIQWEDEPTRFTYQYSAYGYYQKNYSISITEPHLGLWYLGFSTYTTSTFSFVVTETRTCPMRCSLHGQCIGTYCHCTWEYTGLSCEEIRSFVNFNQIYSGFVDQNFWNFYKFTANSDNPVDVILNHESGSDCDLYINAYYKPTRFVYNYRNLSFSSQTNIIVPNPEFTTWWVAIYGVTPCQYQLNVTMIENDNCECVSGVCVDGICHCNSGYIGEVCDQQAQRLQNGISTSYSTLRNGQWFYYQINVTASSQLNIVLQENNTSGMVWIYIAREAPPTLSYYIAADNNSGLPTHRLSIEFPTPQSHTFIIGVYGSPFVTNDVSYSLVAWYTPF